LKPIWANSLQDSNSKKKKNQTKQNKTKKTFSQEKVGGVAQV
jgi:hypothetical protein